MQRCDKGQGPRGIESDKGHQGQQEGLLKVHQQQKEYQGKDGATAEFDGCPGIGRHRDATEINIQYSCLYVVYTDQDTFLKYVTGESLTPK